MKTEWDENKREDNFAKHRLDFSIAHEIFTDYFMERMDTRRDYGEDRWIVLGVIRGAIVVLVYTERDNRLRPISLRKATSVERSIYERAKKNYQG
jgi:uncharacterized DUF497 family protein